ncbi:lactate utilization protein [soil metagenome]
MERAAFLERVRRRLNGDAGPGLPSVVPLTPASGNGLPPAERFPIELAKSGGLARAVPRARLAEAVAEVLGELPSGRRVVVAADVEPYRAEVDAGLEAAAAEVVRPPREEWRAEAATADWGLTSARLGVASTGSLLIVPGPETPRVASLLPPAHLVILAVERLVPGLEQVMPVLTSLANESSAPVLITGASRTSDIEMTTVIGVHGPKVLRVLLVEEGAD